MRLLLEFRRVRSEEHTSELQSHDNLVCRLLLEKKNASGPLTWPPRRRLGRIRRAVWRGRGGETRGSVLACALHARVPGPGGYRWIFFFKKPATTEFSPLPLPAPLPI